MALFYTNSSICANKLEQPGLFNVRAVLRHFILNKEIASCMPLYGYLYRKRKQRDFDHITS